MYNPKELTEWPAELLAMLHRHTELVHDVMKERVRQESKFGKQDRPPHEWKIILDEEAGELSREVCEMYFAGSTRSPNYRAELTQVVAVGLAALENYEEKTPDESDDFLDFINEERENTWRERVSGEIQRVGELRELYLAAPNGKFGALQMANAIGVGRDALAGTSVPALIQAAELLAGFTE